MKKYRIVVEQIPVESKKYYTEVLKKTSINNNETWMNTAHLVRTDCFDNKNNAVRCIEL